MFKSSLFYVALTTIILINVVMMSALNFPFYWLFIATTVGQILLLVMVYKVLTDNYSTNKTFEHFYEDKPIDNLKV